MCADENEKHGRQYCGHGYLDGARIAVSPHFERERGERGREVGEREKEMKMGNVRLPLAVLTLV
jgi:hypothetical protein